LSFEDGGGMVLKSILVAGFAEEIEDSFVKGQIVFYILFSMVQRWRDVVR
jgi:hypothetical protein